MRAERRETAPREVDILARLLNDAEGQLPAEVARYVLTLGFRPLEKARMHDLAVRNQEDALSPAEKEELLAYAKAGTLLSLLKSQARRALGVKPRVSSSVIPGGTHGAGSR